MAKSDIMKVFAENVRKVLDARGWTIQRLADETGYDRSNLSKVIRGVEGCTLEKAVCISKALRVPLSALVDDFSEIVAA